ncbi:hypothetical protein COO91_01111 [Nostoc flagelliforme CCNUN1]|uniref:Uncharacterized protein n=1 Tax=Nostoc flagelliforme CCNUN1 TaxID=2038116 RepID=A0A2K8SII6_9NOSO|nr:hypothetical protein COO91_01111 [Nostoc flagelliforme CCNUN1]
MRTIPFPFALSPLPLSSPACVRSKCEINSRANDFVGFGNLVQMCGLTTRVLHLQTAVFQPEVSGFAIFRFDLEFAT